MKKVFVGISGGVDSSVSAYLLQRGGFSVTGVFIKGWYPDFISCNWRSEMHDAMRVCASLNIPFLLCNAEEEYKRGVTDYMIREYAAGRTPNPDVMCNKEVKFKAFLAFAMQHGADYIATGHYAQKIQNKESYSLHAATDQTKDQTYFLWNMNQDILAKTLFPVGHLKKSAVRDTAAAAKLHTATKKDSQGLCFIGHIDMKDFLRQYIHTTPGDVLDTQGSVIGRHDGALLYTIGERHGFEIFHKKQNDAVLRVVHKDMKQNTITVSNQVSNNISTIVQLAEINAIRTPFTVGQKMLARLRYRQPLQSCVITQCGDQSLAVQFEAEQPYSAPGQSVVFYVGDECLGGGIITE